MQCLSMMTMICMNRNSFSDFSVGAWQAEYAVREYPIITGVCAFMHGTLL